MCVPLLWCNSLFLNKIVTWLSDALFPVHVGAAHKRLTGRGVEYVSCSCHRDLLGNHRSMRATHCLPLPTFWSWTGVWGIFLVNSETEWASNPCVHRTDLAPSWNTQTRMKCFLLLYNKTAFFLAFLSFFIFSLFCCSVPPFSFNV